MSYLMRYEMEYYPDATYAVLSGIATICTSARIRHPAPGWGLINDLTCLLHCCNSTQMLPKPVRF
jgi:hypothetical protein